jgi:hypothetical protein
MQHLEALLAPMVVEVMQSFDVSHNWGELLRDCSTRPCRRYLDLRDFWTSQNVHGNFSHSVPPMGNGVAGNETYQTFVVMMMSASRLSYTMHRQNGSKYRY